MPLVPSPSDTPVNPGAIIPAPSSSATSEVGVIGTGGSAPVAPGGVAGSGASTPTSTGSMQGAPSSSPVAPGATTGSGNTTPTAPGGVAGSGGSTPTAPGALVPGSSASNPGQVEPLAAAPLTPVPPGFNPDLKADVTALQEEIDRATVEEQNLWNALSDETYYREDGDAYVSEQIFNEAANRDAADALLAPRNSPVFTGPVTAPTVKTDGVEFSASRIVSVTSSRSLAATDNGKILVCTGGANIALTVSSALPAGFGCDIISALNAKYVVTLVTSSTAINGITRTQPLPAQTSAELIWRSSNSYLTIIRELSSKFTGSHGRRVLISDDFFHAANWFQMVSGTAHMSPGDYLGSKTGAVTMWTGATNNSVAALGCGINGNCWLQAIQPWRCEFIFAVSDITNCRVRVGFSNCSNTYNPDIFSGSIFCGLDYNPALHANLRYANGEAGTYVYTDSAVVAATGSIKFEMRSGGADQSIYFSINGGPETLLTGQYDFIAGPVFAIRNTSAVDRLLYADYFGLEGYITR